MPRTPPPVRHARLRFEPLEPRLNPGSFTVNDPGTEGDKDPNDGKPLTDGGKVTLQAIYDHIHQKGHGGAHTVTFQGPGTYGLAGGASFGYDQGALTITGQKDDDGPTVTLTCSLYLKDGNKLTDIK